MAKRLVYFADPMCSWCWGFAPVAEAALERFGAEAPLLLFLGGLRPGTTEPLDEAGKQTIREHWEHVHEASGQPFDHDFFARDGFVYDTEPPCRAVVAVRRVAPGTALAFLHHLQRAFYGANRDVTDRATLCDLAEEFGMAREAFAESFDAEETRRETIQDFTTARRLGITGYPTLLGAEEDGRAVALTVGFQPWDRIEPLIALWLSGGADQPQAPA